MTESAVCASTIRFPPSRFTGKERDAESGNDYFFARYYSSAMGRFLSPDWAAKAWPVPYAKLDDPQTLNLYGYLRNNPLGGVDADGHCGGGPNDPPCTGVKVTVDQPSPSMQVNQQSKNGSVTGPGVQATVTVTEGGKPVTGMTVNEKPMVTDNLAENPKPTAAPAGTATTSSEPGKEGTFKDNIIAPQKLGTVSAGEVPQLQTDANNGSYSKTTDQTYTFTTPGGAACQANYTFTLQNVNPNTGKSPDLNSNGVNFTFTIDKPVVVSPQ